MWWWFRLLVMCGLFVCLGLYLFTRTAWLAQVRSWVVGPDRFPALIAQGDRVVAAIRSYRSAVGLWPEYLDDLAPDYLPSVPNRGWFYELTSIDEGSGESRLLPSLSIHPPGQDPRVHLGYDFDPAGASWRLFGNGEERLLRHDPPAAAASSGAATGPGVDLSAAQLRELTRRIEREPTEIEHYRRKAGILVTLGRMAEAREVVAAAAAAQPESYWPRMAMAFLDTTLATESPSPPKTQPAQLPTSAQSFADWVERFPTLTRWFYLSVVYRRIGDDARAASAMVKAIGEPVEIAADDPSIAPYYFWDMARWGLAKRNWGLVIRICNAWERAAKEGRILEESYRPLRAAAELADGVVPGARADMAAMTGKPVWAKNLEGTGGLREAVKQGNRAYRYYPGNSPGEFQVFPAPE
jgi:hypothetical protein